MMNRSALPLITVLALAATSASAGVKYWDNAAFRAFDVGDYVQDGLVLHYDGIRNVGADADHSDTTNTWANLASSGDYPLTWCSWISSNSKYQRVRSDTTQGAWEENGFHFNGQSVFATEESSNLFSLPETYTMQFTMTATLSEATGTSGSGYLFMPGKSWEQGSVGVRNSSNGTTTPANAVYVVDKGRFNNNTTRPNFTDATPRYATVLGTAASLACFDGTSIPAVGTTYTDSCRANVKTRAAHANDWIAFGAQYYASSPPSTTRDTIAAIQGFNGTLHAIRYYDRALTAEELAWNRVVDEARFFGAAAPIPVTNIVVATTVEGVEGDQPCGAYALDAEGYTFTAPARQMIRGRRYLLAGYTIETWNGSGWSSASTYESGSYAATASGTVRLTWQYEHPEGEGQLAHYDVGDYVQSGLVLHYDGIRNVGADAAHDPAATTWVNLGSEGGTYDLTLKDSPGNVIAATGGDAGTWTDDGFAYVGQSRFNCSTAHTWGPDYTIQVLADAKRSSLKAQNAPNYIFATAWNQCALAYYTIASRGLELHTQGAPSGSSHFGPYLPLDTLTYATATLDGENRRATIFTGTEVPTDASLTGVTNYTSAIKSNSNGFNVGGWGGGGSTGANFLVGTMKNLRVYDRVLTGAELAQNRKVDEYRFFGRYTEPNVIVQSTYSYLEGYERNGDYEVDGSFTFTAPESVTAANGITYACDGYTVEKRAGTVGWELVGGGTGNSYLYDATAGLVRLTWKWKATRGLRAAADYSLDDLSPAGLRLHYDGLLNAGVDSPRSTSATKWANLGSDGAAMDLKLTKGTGDSGSAWGDQGFYFGGHAKFESPSTTWTTNSFTAQTLVDAAFADNASEAGNYLAATAWPRFGLQIWGYSSAARLNALGEWYMDPRPRFETGTGKLDYVTAIQDGDAKTTALFPGTSAPTSGGAADGFREYTVCSNEYSSVLRVGGWGGNIHTSDQFLTGTVKNFRYYDRVLTDEELLRNRQVDSVRYFGALAVTNFVVAVEEGANFVATPAPGAYFVEGSNTFSVARGTDTPTHFKLHDWDEAQGKWVNLRQVTGTDFAYAVTSATASKMKVTWCKTKAFMLIVR